RAPGGGAARGKQKPRPSRCPWVPTEAPAKGAGTPNHQDPGNLEVNGDVACAAPATTSTAPTKPQAPHPTSQPDTREGRRVTSGVTAGMRNAFGRPISG